jgi:hypothetical protein
MGPWGLIAKRVARPAPPPLPPAASPPPTPRSFHSSSNSRQQQAAAVTSELATPLPVNGTVSRASKSRGPRPNPNPVKRNGHLAPTRRVSISPVFATFLFWPFWSRLDLSASRFVSSQRCKVSSEAAAAVVSPYRLWDSADTPTQNVPPGAIHAGKSKRLARSPCIHTYQFLANGERHVPSTRPSFFDRSIDPYKQF